MDPVSLAVAVTEAVAGIPVAKAEAWQGGGGDAGRRIGRGPRRNRRRVPWARWTQAWREDGQRHAAVRVAIRHMLQCGRVSVCWPSPAALTATCWRPPLGAVPPDRPGPLAMAFERVSWAQVADQRVALNARTRARDRPAPPGSGSHHLAGHLDHGSIPGWCQRWPGLRAHPHSAQLPGSTAVLALHWGLPSRGEIPAMVQSRTRAGRRIWMCAALGAKSRGC